MTELTYFPFTTQTSVNLNAYDLVSGGQDYQQLKAMYKQQLESGRAFKVYTLPEPVNPQIGQMNQVSAGEVDQYRTAYSNWLQCGVGVGAAQGWGVTRDELANPEVMKAFYDLHGKSIIAIRNASEIHGFSIIFYTKRAVQEALDQIKSAIEEVKAVATKDARKAESEAKKERKAELETLLNEDRVKAERLAALKVEFDTE